MKVHYHGPSSRFECFTASKGSNNYFTRISDPVQKVVLLLYFITDFACHHNNPIKMEATYKYLHAKLRTY